jgi:predicted phosphodiesterase
MDRIAIISDIHGNIPALESVLSDIRSRGIERTICLGDLAGKGPCSAQAVDMIRENCEVVIKGNWDYFMSELKDEALIWHQSRLGEERLDFLRQLQIYVEFYMSGKLVRLCHASPNDLFHRVHMATDDEERIKLFAPTSTLQEEADVVGYGDIHGAYVDSLRGKIIFNVGSVGNPLDIPQASYTIMEGEYGARESSSFSITNVRVPYDIELAVSQALETDMPELKEYIGELRTAIYRKSKKA